MSVDDLMHDICLDLDGSDAHIYNEFQELKRIDSEIDDMIGLSTSIENYGLTPSLLSVVGNRGNLAKTTTLNTVSYESLKEGWRPNDPRVKLAVEAVGAALTRVISNWIGKASGVITVIGNRILSILSKGAKILTSPITIIAAAVAGGIATTSDMITAHPWQTVVMAASAMAGVPALIAMITRTSLPSSLVAMRMWYKVIADGIVKSPLGKFFAVRVRQDGIKLVKIVKEPVKAAASRLGYQGSAVQRIAKSMLELFGKNGPIMKVLGTLKSWVGRAFQELRKADKALMGPKKTAIGKVLRFSWDIFRSSFTTPFGLLLTSISQFSKALKKTKKQKDNEEIDKHNKSQEVPDKS